MEDRTIEQKRVALADVFRTATAWAEGYAAGQAERHRAMAVESPAIAAGLAAARRDAGRTAASEAARRLKGQADVERIALENAARAERRYVEARYLGAALERPTMAIQLDPSVPSPFERVTVKGTPVVTIDIARVDDKPFRGLGAYLDATDAVEDLDDDQVVDKTPPTPPGPAPYGYKRWTTEHGSKFIMPRLSPDDGERIPDETPPAELAVETWRDRPSML